MSKRSKSSARWLAEHAADPYVKRAHEEGWRSRAAFKLEEIHTAERLRASLGEARVDLVMSDMAPNMSGMADVDHDRSMHLVDLAVDFAGQTLRPGGDLLMKVFQGREFQPLIARLRRGFESVKLRKPKASRARSAELYVLARGYRLV